MRRFGWVLAVGCLAGSGMAQTAATVVDVPVPLLPQGFGAWQRAGVVSDGPRSEFALASLNPDALKECGEKRSETANYLWNDRGNVHDIRVESIEFNDATGAYSAFTLAVRPGMKLGKELGAASAVGDGVVLFEVGSTLALIYPATGVDVAELNKLANVLPKVSGPRSQPPLLPTFFPAKGMAAGSLRYALGPASYGVMGGTLAPAQLGWEKSAEAATAEYVDKRGKETLTLLLYPTPQIAGEHERALAAAGAKARREGELVIVAAGTFGAEDTQKMVDGIHLRSEVSFDKPMPLEFHTELRKTYSLLQSIAVLSGMGMLAAVVLGLFLGGGRALLRKAQGKDMATEAEFLSLHLDPQNPRPKFDPPGS